jgi:flagellar protein FliO/FliZ
VAETVSPARPATPPEAPTVIVTPPAAAAAAPAVPPPAQDVDDALSAALASDLARLLEADAIGVPEAPARVEPVIAPEPPRAAAPVQPPAAVVPAVQPEPPRKDPDFSSLEDEMARLLDELAGDVRRS